MLGRRNWDILDLDIYRSCLGSPPGWCSRWSGSPVLNGNARHRSKVTVHRDNGSVSKSPSDRGDPDVILTDWPAELFQLESDSAILERTFGVHKPQFSGCQCQIGRASCRERV